MSDLDLARRAVACPRWPRIRSDGSYRTMNGVLTFREHDTGRLWIDVGGISHDWLPDLEDAATVGCLEALVQAALGHDGVNVVVEVRWSPATRHRVVRWTHTGDGWGWTPHTIGGDNHASKAAALVAALEAVP